MPKKGYKQSPEHRKKNSEAKMGSTPWNKGKKGIYSEETLNKMSEAQKGKRVGENNPFYGKHHTEETKNKNSISHKNKHPSEKTKLKMSEAKKEFIPWNKGMKGCYSEEHNKIMSESIKGENNPFYGKHHTEESIKKSSDAHKNKHPSEETRRKISEYHIGKPSGMKGKTGKNNPNWKGGTKIALCRFRRTIKGRQAKQKHRNLGFIPLNEWESNNNGFEGHHLDKEHVLYIPKELHGSVRHNVHDGYNMNEINIKVIDWYIEYYNLI